MSTGVGELHCPGCKGRVSMTLCAGPPPPVVVGATTVCASCAQVGVLVVGPLGAHVRSATLPELRRWAADVRAGPARRLVAEAIARRGA